MNNEEKLLLSSKCSMIFSPSAPINRKRLFAGRIKQIRMILEAATVRGRHALMYGERGVGKTSLANILNDLFKDAAADAIRIVKINCMEADSFENVWRKAMAEMPLIAEFRDTAIEGTLDEFIEDGRFGPGDVRHLLQRVSQEGYELVIVFDEFDRLPKKERDLFADTVKDLSDNSVCTTLVLVGVAKDVNELIVAHASVDRCVTHILMPLMDAEELKDILRKSMNTLEMTFSDDAADLIVSLSQGLPHYAHLLGQESTYKAIDEGRWNVSIDDVRNGIEQSLEKTQQSVRNDYHKAAQGQRKGTLFPQVLLACALAESDEMGYFASADAREPLRQITGREYDIPNYSQHLDKFSSDPSRGPVLEKKGTSRRFRFRFRNPLLRPFIIMKGLSEGAISGDLIKCIRATIKDRAPENGFLFR